MKTNDIQISIIIPAYNAEKTIARSLQSVADQEGCTLEAIVVDDGSKDRTEAIAREYSERYSCIHYVKQENAGVSSARNKGISLARGTYLLFLDSDDELGTNMCCRMLQYARQFPADMVVCGFYTVCNGEVKQQCTASSNLCGKLMGIQDAFEPLFWGLLLNQPWNKLFRRDKIRRHFNINKRNGEDLEFVLEFMRNGRSLVVMEDCLYLNHIDEENSLSRNYGVALRDLRENQLYLLQYLREESVPIYHNSISDYLISQLWSNAVLGNKSNQIPLKQAVEWMHFDDAYIQKISHLHPHKVGNRIVRFLIVKKWLRLYRMFLQLLVYVK